MRTNIILATFAVLLSLQANAQSLEKMQWFNEPENYSIRNGVLEMQVPAQTDFWRIAHYGFTVDDGPFLYAVYGGEFEAKIKVSGEYETRFDQAGMMIRLDHENYVKFGIEFVDGKFNISAVVTHHTSDWSVIRLEEPIPHAQGRPPAGCNRTILQFRRQGIHDDAHPLDAGQLPFAGGSRGSLPGRTGLQGPLL